MVICLSQSQFHAKQRTAAPWAQERQTAAPGPTTDARVRGRKKRMAALQGRKRRTATPSAQSDGRPPPSAENGGRPLPQDRKRRTAPPPQRTATPGIGSAEPDGRPLLGAAVRGWGGGRPWRPRADGHPWRRPSAETRFRALCGSPWHPGSQRLARTLLGTSAGLAFRKIFAAGRAWACGPRPPVVGGLER